MLRFDQQAANKVLEICGSSATQNELVAQWEAVSGKHVKTTTISGEDLANRTAGANTSALLTLDCLWCPKSYCLPASLDVWNK